MRYALSKLVRGTLLVLLIATATALHSTERIGAQSPARPNVVASIYPVTDSATPSDQAYIALFKPGNNVSTRLTDIAPESLLDISDDGKMIAVTGSSDVSGTDSSEDRLAYGFIGQTLRVVTIDKGHRILWGAFSPDSRYLSYTTAAQDTEDWMLGLIDLSSGNEIAFTGKTTGTATTFAGAGDVVGWSMDDKRLYVRNYMPYSATGGFDSLYTLDISGVSFDKPGHYPLPAATRLVKEGQEIINYDFSDDGTKVALLLADPTNPPAAFSGTDTPPGIVSVRDTATGSEIMAIPSDKGQAFEFALTWTPDNQKVLFAGGSFNNSASVVAPMLYVADVASKQVNKVPTTTDPATTFVGALACSDSLFYITTKDDPTSGSPVSTLHSMPLATLSSPADLVTSSYISLLKCVP